MVGCQHSRSVPNLGHLLLGTAAAYRDQDLLALQFDLSCQNYHVISCMASALG